MRMKSRGWRIGSRWIHNRSVTRGKPVDLAGIPAHRQAELYQVRVHVMGNICYCLIQPYTDYLVSVDTKERWHYKVLSLSLPDLKNPMRLNGYAGTPRSCW